MNQQTNETLHHLERLTTWSILIDVKKVTHNRGAMRLLVIQSGETSGKKKKP